MVRHIIFGGVDSRDYGAIIDGGESYAGAERDYESVPIPGRSGELTVDNGRYKNVPIPYTMMFPHAWELEAYRERMLSLTGYRRLEDSERADEYRMARLQGGFAPTVSGVHNRHGEVTVTFDCMPQRFLKDGECPRMLGTGEEKRLFNPTPMAAKPMVRVYGAGVLTVAGTAITIKAHGQEFMDIDCDRQECYCGAENLNEYLIRPQGDFPGLGPGWSTIALGPGLRKAILYPRWWRL